MTARAQYWRIIHEIKSIHRKKSADYGMPRDPFHNLRASENFGIPPWVGAALRMQDKMARIQAFVLNKNLQNESVEDSFLDLANYAILALALYREEREADK